MRSLSQRILSSPQLRHTDDVQRLASVRLFACLSVCLSVSLSVRLPVCLSVPMSVYLCVFTYIRNLYSQHYVQQQETIKENNYIKEKKP